MSAPDRRAQFAAALEAARQRMPGEYVFEIEFYCERPRCVARTITVRIKELDEPIPIMSPPRCPLCRAPLKTHGVQTLAEADAAFEESARVSVNAQLYIARERARLGDPHALVGIPLGVILNTRLPDVARPIEEPQP